jgi:anaerobic magnesium-protoporphyrin IX monomethyl ester cyclase
MRIVLLYPPPWKIPAPGAAPDRSGDGPPEGLGPGDIDADFWQIPYGLLSLATQALRAGHSVKVLNLSAFAWTRVAEVIAALDAELWGLSCFTANRRGVGLVAQEIRRQHRSAHVCVGGPHPTTLAAETLRHSADIDTVVMGEGEESFLELCQRLEAGRPTAGIAGTAWRTTGGVRVGPARRRIAELDALACPHGHFATHLVLTARGCPGRCTFCATEAVWGHAYRAHSVPYVLDMLEQALARLPVRMVVFKDETFTANRKRGLELCQGMIERKLDFVWSCDTRADSLSEELARAMRLAGCQRLSFGVESGSPEVLRAIRKNVTPETILEATEIAKRFGLQVRFFMMLGNRGETAETLRQSLELVRRAKPHQALFACLSVYPGTQDFVDLERAGVLEREAYFRDDFLELKMPFDASAEDEATLSEWFYQHRGLQQIHRDGIAELEPVLARLGEHHAAHLDLGAACYREGQLERAERHVRRALELGYPLPGLAHNYLCCIAAEQGDLARMQAELALGEKLDPQHLVLVRNRELVRSWLAAGAARSSPRPKLVSGHDFELLERTRQPTLPGPLPADFAKW